MQPHKKKWPAIVIRVFGVLNVLMGLIGVAALMTSLILRLQFDPWPQDPLYLAQAYYIRSGINLVFVVLTILGGIYLLRVQQRGWTVCKVLFFGEIAYFFVGWYDFLLYWALGDQARLILKAFGASGGTGNMGTGIQIITGYPVIALIGLSIAYARLRHAPTSTGRVAQAGAG